MRTITALAFLLLASCLSADEPAVRQRRVLMFVSDSCIVCRIALAETQDWMRPSGWTFGSTADNHVQIVNDERLSEEFRVGLEPTFVLLVDGREAGRVIGYQTGQTVETRRRVICDLFVRGLPR